MKDIYEKDFEYYENRASYFAYTHEPADYDCGISDEYFELDQKVIKAVEKLGTQDREEARTIRGAVSRVYCIRETVTQGESRSSKIRTSYGLHIGL